MADILAGFNDLYLKSPSQDFGKNQILAIHHRKINFCFLGTAWGITVVGLKAVRSDDMMTSYGGADKKLALKKTSEPSEAKSFLFFEHLWSVFIYSTSDVKCRGSTTPPQPVTQLTGHQLDIQQLNSILTLTTWN